MANTRSIETEPHGTWWQRLLIAVFSLAMTLLFFWALGFILQDIGRLPGPDWNRFTGDRLDPGSDGDGRLGIARRCARFRP